MLTALLIVLAGVIGFNVGFFFGAIFGGAAATAQLDQDDDPWAVLQREASPYQ